MSQRIAREQRVDGRADFDFLIGYWDVQHRRLRERLKGSTDWEELTGTSAVRKALDGLGNVDEITMESATGRTKGMTLRLFDPQSQQWRLYWASSLDGRLQPPMIGQFQDGRGEFYDQETFEGRSIFSRFVWTSLSAARCRWEQAFSADGGRTWETNWIMEFTRRKDSDMTQTEPASYTDAQESNHA